MEKKFCSKCGETKSTDSFNKKKAGYSSVCRDCQKIYWSEWYSNPSNRRKHISQSREHSKTREQKLKEMVREAKNKPCADCRLIHPYWRMQFDHLPGTVKMGTINEIWKHSEEVVLAEIQKCEVVCANCHADRTYHRQMTKTGL
jgi:DNA-directed RNA polymerase subunit M/transcription elongation factor TFIIS